jgi:hypothetical protein
MLALEIALAMHTACAWLTVDRPPFCRCLSVVQRCDAAFCVVGVSVSQEESEEAHATPLQFTGTYGGPQFVLDQVK